MKTYTINIKTLPLFKWDHKKSVFFWKDAKLPQEHEKPRELFYNRHDDDAIQARWDARCVARASSQAASKMASRL